MNTSKSTKLVVGIHPDLNYGESYSEKWSKYLGDRGVEVRWLNLLALDALDQARMCDGVMWRCIHIPQQKQIAQRILYTVEHCLGIPVFPDSRTRWHYDEKISQYYLLQTLQAPIPNTWLFWNRKEALEWAITASYPVVFKLSSGASSANVLKIETDAEAIALIHRSFTKGIFPYTMNEFQAYSGFPRSREQFRDLRPRLKEAIKYVLWNEYPKLHETWWRLEHGYAYFQEFLPGNDFDTRITVIGDRAFGFRRMNRPNDFRASGSGRLSYDPELVDKRCVEIAFEMSKAGNFQSMAYDFLYKNEKPVICEISYTFVNHAVFNCPGHWNSNMNWIEGHVWPEEAQVEDFYVRISTLEVDMKTRLSLSKTPSEPIGK